MRYSAEAYGAGPRRNGAGAGLHCTGAAGGLRCSMARDAHLCVPKLRRAWPDCARLEPSCAAGGIAGRGRRERRPLHTGLHGRCCLSTHKLILWHSTLSRKYSRRQKPGLIRLTNRQTRCCAATARAHIQCSSWKRRAWQTPASTAPHIGLPGHPCEKEADALLCCQLSAGCCGFCLENMAWEDALMGRT